MLKFYKYHDWIEKGIVDIFPYIHKENIDNMSSCVKQFIPNRNILYWLPLNPSDIAMNIINEDIQNINQEVLLISIVSDLCHNSNDNAVDILEKYEKYISKLMWRRLILMNSNKAVELCKKTNNIDMFYLSSNNSVSALDIICDNIDKVDWSELSSNTNDKAIALLKECPERIDWKYLSANTNNNVYDLLIENLEKISLHDLARNTNRKILSIIDNNMEKMDDECWEILCENTSDKALEILENNQNKINWNILAENNNDKAIKLLMTNLDKFDNWHLYYNTNPKVFEFIIKENLFLPIWFKYLLQNNPNIFVYNYEAIREHMKNTWLTDLLKYWHHPKNTDKWKDWGWDDCPDLDNFGL
jgi:vacuolar-type H+-ATPase subunit H